MEEKNLEQAEISNGKEEDAAIAQNASEPENSASGLGKFKNAEALLNAYKNLEAEFTKKSQQLAKANELINSKDTAKDALPLYEKESWNDLVNEFVAKYPKAKDFTEKISKIICQDFELSKKESCLSEAYLRVLNDEIKAPQDALDDDDFIEKHVLKNDKIKKRVLLNYLKSKSENPSPSLLTGKSGKAVFSPVNAPKTIKEAGELAKKLL